MCCLAAILTTPRYNTYFVGFVASVLGLDQAVFYGLILGKYINDRRII